MSGEGLICAMRAMPRAQREKPNLCYGCNRVAAPDGDLAPFYCGGCVEWDEVTSDPGDDGDEE